MSRTLDVSHFEISALKRDAPRNISRMSVTCAIIQPDKSALNVARLLKAPFIFVISLVSQFGIVPNPLNAPYELHNPSAADSFKHALIAAKNVVLRNPHSLCVLHAHEVIGPSVPSEHANFEMNAEASAKIPRLKFLAALPCHVDISH